jgi:hypothetical protein
MHLISNHLSLLGAQTRRQTFAEAAEAYLEMRQRPSQ